MSTVLLNGESKITFDHNIASWRGGALYCTSNCNISFHEESLVKFYNNSALLDGGGAESNSKVLFYGTSFVIFKNNSAFYGGAVKAYTNSRVSFDEFSITTFTENTATLDGGAVIENVNSTISFIGHSNTILKRNKATGDRGAICCIIHCNILFSGNSNTTFSDSVQCQNRKWWSYRHQGF